MRNSKIHDGINTGKVCIDHNSSQD